MESDICQRTHCMLTANIEAATRVFAGLDALAEPLGRATNSIATALAAGRKLLSCGNGGSAADSAHLAAEIVGRYVMQRPGFAAVDLSSQPSAVTALINDFPPEQVFARMVQAIGAEGDVLVVFSSSGNSVNVKLALEAAGTNRMSRIAFLGRTGGQCKGIAEVELIVPAETTARIQEAHQMMYHTICDVLDPILASQ